MLLRPGLVGDVGHTQSKGVGYTAEALALFARFTTPPTEARKGLINALIVALKAAGVWTKLDAFYMLAAADAQAAQRNWKADAYNLSPQSAPTFDADRGYTGNGTSSYLATSFNPFTAGGQFALNSAHIGVYSRTSGTAQSLEIGARLSNVSQQTVLQLRNASDQFTARINQDVVSDVATGVTDGSGHFVGSRTGASARSLYRNGSALTASVEASTAMPNFEIFILAGNTNGSAANFSARQLSVAHWGAALTAQNVTDLNAAIGAYLTTVGAA